MIVFVTYIQGSYLYPADYNCEWIHCLTKLDRLSIHSSLLIWATSPSNPAKSALLFLCRTGANSRPRISLPKISGNILPSTRRTLFRTGPTGQTHYQILVLTGVNSHSGSGGYAGEDSNFFLPRVTIHWIQVRARARARGRGMAPVSALVGFPTRGYADILHPLPSLLI
jgi:hypothetical protein